ncbi:MAG: hypothetical protein IJJ26_05955 [Victivallales bacterium]|nr:hypothetical protein [Victivallales bacterium]
MLNLIDDTSLLQQKLDQTGLVCIDEPRVYLLQRTLVIHSHTRLVAAPGVIFRAAPNSRCALIENEHFASQGKERDEDIHLEGGLWDGNCDQMGLDPLEETAEHNRIGYAYDPAVFKGKLLRFAHVDHISLEKLTVKDPVSYGIQIADTHYFIVRDLLFDYNNHFGTTDGVHINGPAAYGLIENIMGVTNDDIVSLTTVDEAHAEVSRGTIRDIEIRNISAENGYSGIRLLSCGEPMLHVRISGVYGSFRHNAVLISQHNVHPGEPIWFDDITVEHVHAHKSGVRLQPPCHIRWEKDAIETLPVVWFAFGSRVGNATLRDIYRYEDTETDAPLVGLDPDVSVERLVLDNIAQSCKPGVTPPLIDNRATVRTLLQR